MLAQLQQFWNNLGTVAKIVYSAVAVVLLGSIGAVGYWSSQTKYDVLFAKLPNEDAAVIVDRLVADRVSYKIKESGEGTTIMVPAATAPEQRMKLSVAGLPQSSGKGYEIFDSMSMGATPFMQNIASIRATQGELARTIMTLEPVAHARVHIVQPEPTPFVREEKPVTASIVIKTKAGKTLSREATKGIVQMTAGAVKGLSVDNVTVLDIDGRVLSEKKDSRGSNISNEQLAYQREVETHLANNAQELLTRAMGPGRAVVRVTAEMSFRHVKEFSEKFDPEGRVGVNEQVMSMNMTGAAPVRGPVGVTSNVPAATPSTAPTAVVTPVPTKNDETVSTQYVVSHVNQEKTEQQGIIDRLTVAVILLPQKGEGDALEDVVGISLDEARELVKNAVSFKEGRDQIQVSVAKTPGEGQAAPAEAAVSDDRLVAGFPMNNDYVSVVRSSALGVAGLLFLAIVFKAMRRRPSRSPSPVPAFAALSADGRPVPDDLMDLHAVAATIKAWLEEPAVIRMDAKPQANMPLTKPA